MALPANQTEAKQFNPEEHPNLFHICCKVNGKVAYGNIIHNQPFYIIGEKGKETEIGRYDKCTRCNKILSLRFNNILSSKYKDNIHKCFMEDDGLTFLYKDEVINGYLNPELRAKANEDYNTFKNRFISVLKKLGYAYTQNA